MEKYEYFGGVPEVGIVPRAPHAGPLLRHVYEQEHGRGGFAGKVSHTYHLYPPTNWIAEEARVLDGAAWAPHWESPMRAVGGTHHALEMFQPPAAADVYRGMARLVANATVAMNVTAPQASMDYFFEHHSATLRLLRASGRGHARDDVRAHRIPEGRLPDRPQGHHPSLRHRARAPVLLDVRELRGRSREGRVAPPPADSSRTARATTAFRARSTRATRRGASRSSPRWRACTRAACTPPIPSTRWAGGATISPTSSRWRTCAP